MIFQTAKNWRVICAQNQIGNMSTGIKSLKRKFGTVGSITSQWVMSLERSISKKHLLFMDAKIAAESILRSLKAGINTLMLKVKQDMVKYMEPLSSVLG